MKRGFTILELLVAALLLGMLVTILTMIFNQSSIAWRTGEKSIADLDDVRRNIARIRDEADNVYPWNGKNVRIVGLWREGDRRNRAVDVNGDQQEGLQSLGGNFSKLSDVQPMGVGSGDSGSGFSTYIVNVKCAGPDRQFGTWDDIWSFPDDFE